MIVAYLDKVTKRMAFPVVFRGWLKMLHMGATTKLLSSGLSREIPVSFSFPQGDCIAGDLYCLTQEPLLRMLRSKLQGLQVTNFHQKDADYMDDASLCPAACRTSLSSTISSTSLSCSQGRCSPGTGSQRSWG